ncbi:MAG TPA: ATP synthase F0 subunit C [Candidatus Binataceae bacterium]|jgi:F-type H+-transporting ATPase subunit c|nr:ATP synthase F0 subunit C [Candidatus Binataceae bacterium]
MIGRLGKWLGMAAAMVMASPLLAMAQTPGGGGGDGMRAGLIGLGAGLGIGIAALGCGMGQGKLAASAMESIGRNPNSTNQLFVPMIIGLAFVESLTLYSLVISFILQGKI